MYAIIYAKTAAEEIAELQAGIRKRVREGMAAQLRHEPAAESQNRKPLHGLEPPWQRMGAVWELRIGEYRVFYEVDEAAQSVTVQAVRHKPPHRTTADIL